MRIVIIITGLNTGGAEAMLLKVLERLDRRRFSPHVFSLGSLGDLAPRIQALGIPVEALGMRPQFPSPFAFSRLVWRLKKLRPDVVHTWMYHADLLGGLAARMAGVPAIGWGIHHSNLDAGKTKASTRAVVWLCARLSRWVPDSILCCAHAAQAVHQRIGYAAEKMVVIPNGFDLSRFNPDAGARLSVRQELGLAPDTLLVGLIGRFDPQKNHAGFVEAAAALHRQMPAVHFVLAGKDVNSANAELMAAIQQAQLVSVIHLLDVRQDIPRLMAALDVLASSSYGEAFPNVLGEAMACGVPCMVTDVGDSALIVGDTGRVVASGDMAGLAAALQELLSLPVEERTSLGKRARARVAAHFEMGQVIRQYEAFYEELADIGRKKNAA
jgi:glycosyltransferase involved in cell wall biosynthesis